jgi:hypothetical protein
MREVEWARWEAAAVGGLLGWAELGYDGCGRSDGMARVEGGRCGRSKGRGRGWRRRMREAARRDEP